MKLEPQMQSALQRCSRMEWIVAPEAEYDRILLYLHARIGVVLTHRSVDANIVQCIPLIKAGPEQRFLIVAPLYHVAAAFMEKRPEGLRLMDDAKAGKIDVVAFLKTDRLARSLRHLLDIVDFIHRFLLGMGI